jgi:hypothetical protein
MFVAACAAPSVQEVSGEGETGKKYKTVISKSGVSEEGGPMITCLTTYANDIPIQDACATGRGTAQGAAEALPAALVGAGAGLGAAYMIGNATENAARNLRPDQTNVTVGGARASASAGATGSGHYKGGRTRYR